MDRTDTLDPLASVTAGALRGREPRSRRRGYAAVEQPPRASLDRDVSTPNVGFFHRRPRACVRLLLEFQVVRAPAGRIFVPSSHYPAEFGGGGFGSVTAVFLSICSMVV